MCRQAIALAGKQKEAEGAPVVAQLPGTATANEIKAVADEIAADATEEHDRT